MKHAAKLTAISAAVVGLVVQFVLSMLAGNYAGAATALVGIILAYLPAAADLLKVIEPNLPAWLAALAALLIKLPSWIINLFPPTPPTPPLPSNKGK